MERKRKTNYGIRSLGRGSIASILSVYRKMNHSFFLSWRKARQHPMLCRTHGPQRFGLTSLYLLCRKPPYHRGIISHYLGKVKRRYLE